MAGFVDKFKRMWDAPDDEYEYNDYDDYDTDESDREEESRSSRRSTRESSRDTSRYDDFDEPVSSRDSSRRNKVVNISATAKLSVALFKPERFGEETRNIADEHMARRIIDFLSGVAYANRGKIKKVATSTFIIIPNNVDLTGDDLLDELEHSGVYF